MKISIPQPCHENWNEMLPEEKGRFCLSCQKCVLDLTKMTDDEILNISKQKDICVRLDAKQIERFNSNQNFKLPNWFKYSSFLILFGLSNHSFSQENQIQTINEDSTRLIFGKIINKENVGVSYAMIGLKGHRNLRVVSDSLGKFKIEIPNSITSNEFFIDIDYGTYEYKLEEKKENLIQLNDYSIITESFVVGQVFYKKSFLRRTLDVITWPFRQIGKIF